jgi:hypothetical protein
MKTKTNVFKIASKNMKNIHALTRTGIWAFPSNTGSYRTLTNQAKVGDKLIFTNAGEPVAVGELMSLPSDLVSTNFPDGNAYGSSFTVKVEGHGRIKRAERNRANIDLKRGVVSTSDTGTFKKVLKRLKD